MNYLQVVQVIVRIPGGQLCMEINNYANRAEAANDIDDYIVGFYNSNRLHSKLGNLSPNAFERESTSKKSIKLSEIT